MTTAPHLSALDDARRLAEPALRDALARLDPQTRHACGYHRGYTDAEGQSLQAPAGKGIRPALALLSARAAGAAPERGVPAAVACELVHDFSLLHDDVMDGDVERRHRPTVWARFGTATAILAGDALLALAHEVLAEAPSPNPGWAVRCLSATTRRLVAGQVHDLDFEHRDDVTLAACLEMAASKTGALLACSASLGAVLVDAPAELALGLSDYGAHLGLAFQLTDDLLGIWGQPERTGKPVHADLQARKKSLPVVAALTAPGDAARSLAELYRTEAALEPAELERAAALVVEAGGRDWAQAEATRQGDAAVAVLSTLDLPRAVRDDLVALTDLLSGRDH